MALARPFAVRANFSPACGGRGRAVCGPTARDDGKIGCVAGGGLLLTLIDTISRCIITI
jgi:hypothetical protein